MTHPVEIEMHDPHSEVIDDILSEVESSIKAIRKRWNQTGDRIVHTADRDDLLAKQQAIALIWDADMLVSTYPHLSREQAWEVLQECKRRYSAEHGLCWDDVGEIVHARFPDAPEAKQRMLDHLQSLTRRVQALPADEKTNPAAYGEIAAKIDDVAETIRQQEAQL